MTTESRQRVKKQLAPKKVRIDGKDYWVAEGDLLLDAHQLDEYTRQREILEQQQQLGHEATEVGMAIPPAVISSALVAVSTSGDDGAKLVRWKDGVTLWYRIQKDTFASDQEYQTVRTAMDEATAAWERTCGISFRHRASLDGSASQNPRVKFTVRGIDSGGRFIAAAFFPNDLPERRWVLVDPSFFAPNLGFDRTGVLRHELGHVLGFRHEHIRSEAPPACPDEDRQDTIDLTAYDPRSVMHYFCGGVGSRELAITDVDLVGAQRMYGLPLDQYRFYE